MLDIKKRKCDTYRRLFDPDIRTSWHRKTTTAKYLPGKTLVIDVDRTSNVLAGKEYRYCLSRYETALSSNLNSF